MQHQTWVHSLDAQCAVVLPSPNKPLTYGHYCPVPSPKPRSVQNYHLQAPLLLREPQCPVSRPPSLSDPSGTDSECPPHTTVPASAESTCELPTMFLRASSHDSTLCTHTHAPPSPYPAAPIRGVFGCSGTKRLIMQLRDLRRFNRSQFDCLCDGHCGLWRLLHFLCPHLHQVHSSSDAKDGHNPASYPSD